MQAIRDRANEVCEKQILQLFDPVRVNAKANGQNKGARKASAARTDSRDRLRHLDPSAGQRKRHGNQIQTHERRDTESWQTNTGLLRNPTDRQSS